VREPRSSSAPGLGELQAALASEREDNARLRGTLTEGQVPAWAAGRAQDGPRAHAYTANLVSGNHIRQRGRPR
jgi:hypothetical protein